MESKKISVLFVGNSYTSFNNMPQTFFVDIAKEANYDVEVTAITHGGYRLCQYADPENEEGKRVREVTAGKRYDFAVLQDQSFNPIVNEETFLEGVKGLIAVINADKFILYATWGRNDDNPLLAELGLTRMEMTEKLSLAYNKAGKLYGADVAEVGKAFAEYVIDHDKSDIYLPDRSNHPTPLGSKIAAKVLFEQMVE